MTAISTHTCHPLSRLPWWITRWVGYRRATPPILPMWLNCFWSFVAVFCGIAVIQTLFTHIHFFVERGVPPTIANYVASIALIGGIVQSPYAQPRPLYCGQLIGSITGISISKLMHFLPDDRFLKFQWLSASLSCSTTIVIMYLTNNRHPPAAATAILVSIDKNLRALSWGFIPILLFTASLSLSMTLVINNIQRRYPLFWFTPGDLNNQNPIVLPAVGESKMLTQRQDNLSKIKVETSPV